MATDNPGPRSRYYDAILNVLDSDIRPQLVSPKALYSYNLVFKQLARLAAVNDHAPFLPENLASLCNPGTASQATAASTGILPTAIADEGRRLDEFESAMVARLVPRKPAEVTVHALPESINIKSVEAYLRANLDPKARVRDLRILSGGRSKQTILITMNNVSGTPIECIMRRDISDSKTGGSVPEEYGVLFKLAEYGIPVPRPILCEPDASKFGWPFIIVEKITGSLAGHIFDPPGKAAVLNSARALGQLHAVPVADVAPTLRPQFRVAPDTVKLRALIESLRDSWNKNSRAESLTVDYAFNWLFENASDVQPLRAVVHGDCSYHNILFDGDKLTALLDWELVRVGHPAEDLGYIRPAVLNRVTWDEFMAAYRAAGGPEISRKDQLFYTLLEKLRLLAMLFKVRPYVESGDSNDIELVDALVVVIPRIIHQISVEIRGYPEMGG